MTVGPFRAEVLLGPLPAEILARIPCATGRSETSASGGLGLLSVGARGIVA